MLVPRAEAELARARMLELVPEGFEEALRGEEVELAAYADAARAARIRAAFPRGTVKRVAPGWEDAWRAFHRPVRVGPLWVGPPWCDPDPASTAVVVEPGRAFGTGGHATTRLCLRFLLDAARGSLADLGCGSGVLSVAAAKLGFGPVLAVDSDPAAVEATRRNAAANGVGVEVRQADILAAPLPSVDVAVANVTCDAVERLGQRLQADVLVTSGYLAAERPRLPGWVACERRGADGWVADRFRRA